MAPDEWAFCCMYQNDLGWCRGAPKEAPNFGGGQLKGQIHPDANNLLFQPARMRPHESSSFGTGERRSRKTTGGLGGGRGYQWQGLCQAKPPTSTPAQVLPSEEVVKPDPGTKGSDEGVARVVQMFVGL
jgi:hypothetical protein